MSDPCFGWKQRQPRGSYEGCQAEKIDGDAVHGGRRTDSDRQSMEMAIFILDCHHL